VVVFFVAFAASCALLGRSLPFPPVLIVRDKIEYLARHGDEYDVLFIGSSHVQGQVMPSVFDPIVRRGGRPVKSFNAGVAGMFSPEDSYLLEQILQLPHHRLRWVFFELSHVRTGLEREGTARFVYWHDWPRVRLLLRRLWQEAQEGSAQLANHGHAAFAARWDTWSAAGQKMVGHLRQSFARAVNLGRGSDLLDRWIRPRDRAREIAKSLGENGDGWMSAFGVSQEMAAAPRAEYLRAYEERLATPAVLERSDPVSQDALDDLAASVRRSGAVPIFIVPPTTESGHFFPTAEREKDLAVFDFSDVRRYPELYSPEHRIDPDHLNTAGARIFSEELAKLFLTLESPPVQAP
jgi:hypothetical protein